MNCNVGTTDRLVRIALGLLIIIGGFYVGTWWFLIGWIPILTGLLELCPLYSIFGISTTTNFQLIRWAKSLKIKPFYYAMTDEIIKLPGKSNDFYSIINYNNSNQLNELNCFYSSIMN